MIAEIIVCILAGLGAGLGTGFAGDERSGGDQPDADYVSWDGAVSGNRHRTRE